jgi:hypothetical protein
MSRPVTVRGRARIEILEQFYYYGENAGLRTENRFLACSLVDRQTDFQVPRHRYGL